MKTHYNNTRLLFAAFFALASLSAAKAQTEFAFTNKDTIYTVVTKNVPVTSFAYIVNKSGAKLQLAYSLVSSKFDTAWGLFNCDNAECYAKLNNGTTMDTFGGAPKTDTTYFYLDAITNSSRPDTAIARYSFYDPKNPTTQARTVTWIFYTALTGIETTPKPVNISIFPNPAGNTIHIGGVADKAYNNLEIISMTGAKAYTQSALKADGEVNIASFAPGIYIVQFADKAGNMYQGRFAKMD